MQGRKKSNKGDHVWWVLTHTHKDDVLIIKKGMYMGTRALAFYSNNLPLKGQCAFKGEHGHPNVIRYPSTLYNVQSARRINSS